MNRLYKIESITHTGTKGEAGTPVTVGKSGQYYSNWTGMTIAFDNTLKHECAIFVYVESNTGVPMYVFGVPDWMHTSLVQKIVYKPNGDMDIVTLNSVYALRNLNKTLEEWENEQH